VDATTAQGCFAPHSELVERGLFLPLGLALGQIAPTDGDGDVGDICAIGGDFGFHVTGGSASSSEVALVRGPQGSEGPEGPAGPTGAQGPQGTTGATGSTGALAQRARRAFRAYKASKERLGPQAHLARSGIPAPARRAERLGWMMINT
jgi:hypothetical protein